MRSTLEIRCSNSTSPVNIQFRNCLFSCFSLNHFTVLLTHCGSYCKNFSHSFLILKNNANSRHFFLSVAWVILPSRLWGCSHQSAPALVIGQHIQCHFVRLLQNSDNSSSVGLLVKFSMGEPPAACVLCVLVSSTLLFFFKLMSAILAYSTLRIVGQIH